MLSFMRRWSAPFEKYDINTALLTSIVNTPLLTSVVTTPLLADDDDIDDDGECERLQPICSVAEEIDDGDKTCDENDDDVFETGWPDSAKNHSSHTNGVLL